MFQLKGKVGTRVAGLFLALAMLAGNFEAAQASQRLAEDFEAVQASPYLEEEGIEQRALGASVKKAKGLEYQSQKADTGVICIIKNTKSYALNLTATCSYYNKSKKKIGEKTAGNYSLEPGKRCVMFFARPRNSKNQYASYKSYKIGFKAKRTSNSITYGTKYIKTLKKSKSSSGITAKFKNNSKTKWQFVHATCVFYDSKGKPVGQYGTYLHCEKPKSVVTVTFRYPYGADYKPIKGKSYKIFIDYAYKYGSSR